MKPTDKNPDLDKLYTSMFGIDRKKSIQNDTCVFCNEPVSIDDFKDELSLKEYCISGICQKCQDEIFI